MWQKQVFPWCDPYKSFNFWWLSIIQCPLWTIIFIGHNSWGVYFALIKYLLFQLSPIITNEKESIHIWATSWQNQQNDLCIRPAKTQISLCIRPVWSVFAVRSMGSWGPDVSSCGQRRLWSDWMDAQADLSFRWVHMQFCWYTRTLKTNTKFQIKILLKFEFI